ncbi:MAG: hypothetical protein E7517_07405 [Ruminococcaceae bacterium]|nr:hypothetical protein [Oscillospiraceae bacterium]
MSDWNDWIGDSRFDLDGDGEYDIFEEAGRQTNHLITMGVFDDDDGDYDYNDDWQDYCEDGSEYGLYPEDFDDEEDYEMALEEAREAEEDEEEGFGAFMPTPVVNIPITFSIEVPQGEHESKDYPNARQKQAAGFWDTFGDNSPEGKRAAFIIGNAASIPAANYLTADGRFLYAQAIKDHFTVPCALPDEDLEQEIEFWDIFRKLQCRDGALTLEVWDWCLQQFAPYAEYAVAAEYDLWFSVLSFMRNHAEDFLPQCVDYIAEHPAFLEAIQKLYTSGNYIVYILIIEALKQHRAKIANALFNMEFEAAKNNWKDINLTMQSLVDACYCFDEPMAVKYIKNHYLAKLKTLDDGMVLDEIPEWEEKLNKTIADLEQWG